MDKTLKIRNTLRRLRYGRPLLDYYRFSKPLSAAKIRRFTEADYDRCSEIYSLNEVGRFPEGYLPKFQENLLENDSLIVVLEKDTTIIGTGGISIHEYADDFMMAGLSFGLIDPTYHRKGFGTLLFCTRLCFLEQGQDWYISMTSAGNGTENYYKNLGFQFLSTIKENDEPELESYHVKVVSNDLKRFRRLIDESESEVELNFGTPVPKIDYREDFEKLRTAQ